MKNKISLPNLWNRASDNITLNILQDYGLPVTLDYNCWENLPSSTVQKLKPHTEEIIRSMLHVEIKEIKECFVEIEKILTLWDQKVVAEHAHE